MLPKIHIGQRRHFTSILESNVPLSPLQSQKQSPHITPLRNLSPNQNRVGSVHSPRRNYQRSKFPDTFNMRYLKKNFSMESYEEQREKIIQRKVTRHQANVRHSSEWKRRCQLQEQKYKRFDAPLPIRNRGSLPEILAEKKKQKKQLARIQDQAASFIKTKWATYNKKKKELDRDEKFAAAATLIQRRWWIYYKKVIQPVKDAEKQKVLQRKQLDKAMPIRSACRGYMARQQVFSLTWKTQVNFQLSQFDTWRQEIEQTSARQIQTAYQNFRTARQAKAELRILQERKRRREEEQRKKEEEALEQLLNQSDPSGQDINGKQQSPRRSKLAAGKFAAKLGETLIKSVLQKQSPKRPIRKRKTTKILDFESTINSNK